MKLKPNIGWIIAKPCKMKDKKTDSGIYIPVNGVEEIRFVIGLVVSVSGKVVVGNQVLDSNIKKGDFIYFDEITTRNFTINGNKYFSIPEEKVYCQVEFTKEELEHLDLPSQTELS